LSGLRRRGDWPDCAQLAVYGPEPDAALLGSAHSVAGELIPTRLLSQVEVSQCVAQHSAAAQLESVVF
jgi:tRNA pseudouridine55 synthase